MFGLKTIVGTNSNDRSFSNDAAYQNRGMDTNGSVNVVALLGTGFNTALHKNCTQVYSRKFSRQEFFCRSGVSCNYALQNYISSRQSFNACVYGRRAAQHPAYEKMEDRSIILKKRCAHQSTDPSDTLAYQGSLSD